MKKMIIFLCAGVFLLNAARGDNGTNGVINGSVRVDTKTNTLAVHLQYKLLATDSVISQLGFYLSNSCRVKSISGTHLVDYSFDTATRPVRTLVLKFDKLSPGDRVFDIAYEMPFDSSRLRQYGFIELGLDWFWFPVHPSFSQWKFIFDLEVATGDQSLGLFSNGRVTALKRGGYRVMSVFPDFDMDLFFLKDAKVYKAGGKNAKVVGDMSNPSLKDSIARTAASYVSFYNQLYQTNVSDVTCVFRPSLPEPNSFGYARKGYFVLSQPAKLDDVKFYIAHELAHLWFLSGEPTENAWLTESLAEYNALLAIKNFEGEESFQKIIEDKKSRIARAEASGKPLPAVARNGSKGKNMLSQMALYHKGPLILLELHQKIGEKNMIALLKKATLNKIKTTEEFLEVLEQLTTAEVKHELLLGLRR
jgi:hypothetical protein